MRFVQARCFYPNWNCYRKKTNRTKITHLAQKRHHHQQQQQKSRIKFTFTTGYEIPWVSRKHAHTCKHIIVHEQHRNRKKSNRIEFIEWQKTRWKRNVRRAEEYMKTHKQHLNICNACECLFAWTWMCARTRSHVHLAAITTTTTGDTENICADHNEEYMINDCYYAQFDRCGRLAVRMHRVSFLFSVALFLSMLH